jgi:energy-coupling factor transporter ATP-binding protein EcfA2
MLKRLHLKNFTVFADANFEFGPGLNVLVGTNGTGKSHVLKLGYASLKTAERLSKGENDEFKLAWNENNTKNFLLDDLKGVFQPELNNVGRLIRWQTPQAKTSVRAGFGNDLLSQFWFGIVKADIPEYAIHLIDISKEHRPREIGRPIFIPAKEVLTLAWISRLSEIRKLPIDTTYTDLLNLLRPLPLLQLEKDAAEVLLRLEDLLGGIIEQSGDRFYLIPKNGARVEIDLVAEGIRKFGTLFQLLMNGSLTKQTTLFWDEPEANLNPALLQKLATILAELARQGFQIILATHSMSLLKEFHILSREKDAKPLPIKYFGLNAGPGEATRIVTADNFEYLPDIVALEVELEQADALEEIFVREDQQRHADNH